MADSKSIGDDKGGMFSNIINEIITSPLNLGLVCVIAFLVYKIFKKSNSSENVSGKLSNQPQIPKLKKRDFTVEELRKFDGHGEDGRVLVAVNGKVFDVTLRGGLRFYGPGGPYSAFAGRDASRGLATFDVQGGKEEYDDLSDLNSMEMDSVKEWEGQFNDRYDYVGRLLKPGEAPTNYSEEEEEQSQPEGGDTKSKDE
uniref:Cytochrome b5 heme-binding domain-containing protein n=1 Tax=Clastoptera arizonana TaxID=38151 RepID=A0A1B6D4G8_9HEMI